MALVRLTPELAESISKKMGITPQQIREGINKGTIEGGRPLGEDSRIYMIDDKYAPKDDSPEPEQIKVEIEPDEVTRDLDKLIAYTEKQKVLCDKYILLQEIRRNRDKPENLKAREEKIVTKETQLINLEASLKEREIKVKDMESQILSQKLKVSQECSEQLTNVGQKHKIIQDSIEELLKKKQTVITELDRNISEKQMKVDALDKKIAEYPSVIAPFKEQLSKMIRVTEIYAAKNYKKAEQTSGATSDYYTRRANYSWSLGDALQKVWQWLNA